MSGNMNPALTADALAAKAGAAPKGRTPRVGDAVVFVGYTVSDAELHAVIARVQPQAGATALANLAVLSPTGGWLPQFQVAYSEMKEQGTWHFRE